jgi:hypothetical protein
MSSVVVRCSRCQTLLKTPASTESVRFRCPKCGTVLGAVPVVPKPPVAQSETQSSHSGAGSAQEATAAHDGSPSSAAATPRFDFLAPSQQSDELGRLGPYRVLALLGTGGMGAVFRAEDPQLRRLVALKVMLPKFAADEVAKQRPARSEAADAVLSSDLVRGRQTPGGDLLG